MIQQGHKFCVIFAFLFGVSLATLPRAQAATLYAGSATQTVQEGQTFVVEWFLDTENRVINTLSLKLKFSSDTLEVADISAGQSLFDLWIRHPEYSNAEGAIFLEAGAAGGVSGEGIPVARTTFRSIKSGPAKIAMDANSAVLLNDGKGTPDTLIFREILFVIGPPGSLANISSPSHPDQDSWYRENKAIIKFAAQPGQEYSFSFSANPEIYPDDLADQIPDEIIYQNLPDGIYYFKLNSKVGNSLWQEVGIFRVQIDRSAPEEFKPVISTDPSMYDGKPFIVFSTVDKTSGMLHYQIRKGLIGGATLVRGPYPLNRPLFGNTIRIEAVDRAGNSRIAEIQYEGIFNWQRLSLLILIILIICLGIFYPDNIIGKRSETKFSS
ncbi:MAG: hypothetical protein U1C57_03145 [Candidatus Doudnabacteria bacterium]|nr:hypothetical protein [bacterium]MDZ4244073.1 hypothetical protein [Candidatus Doudnabacteria bacterium]